MEEQGAKKKGGMKKHRKIMLKPRIDVYAQYTVSECLLCVQGLLPDCRKGLKCVCPL